MRYTNLPLLYREAPQCFVSLRNKVNIIEPPKFCALNYRCLPGTYVVGPVSDDDDDGGGGGGGDWDPTSKKGSNLRRFCGYPWRLTSWLANTTT